MAVLVMKNELAVGMLVSAIFPHPSLSEAFEEAVWDIENEAVNTLKKLVKKA